MLDNYEVQIFSLKNFLLFYRNLNQVKTATWNSLCSLNALDTNWRHV